MCTLFQEVIALAIIDSFKRRYKRVHYGLDTRGEFLLQYLDRIAAKFFRKTTTFYRRAHIRRLANTFTDGNIYRIRDVKFPVLEGSDCSMFWAYIYEDTFGVYVNFDDNHSEKVVNLCDELLNEGAYGLVNSKVNVTVKPGDIVIDAGSWAGDFAAYASVKGGTVYAFEPTDTTFEILNKTAELNGNIIPVKKGLSDESTSTQFFINTSGNSGANRINTPQKPANFTESSSRIETTTIDDFVRTHNLPRVDFIKADIEGFERHMLAGAQDTLARFAPKLALCTYHLPDDPEVMASLILKANPKYNIVQKRMKLFASVPE